VVTKGVQGTVLHPCKKIGVVAGFAELHDQVEHGRPPRVLGARDDGEVTLQDFLVRVALVRREKGILFIHI
jgi:hypothetical protein